MGRVSDGAPHHTRAQPAAHPALPPLQAGKAFAAEELGLDEETLSGRVVSSYGPYTSIVGTAKKTGVAGLTAEPEMGGDRGEVVAAKDAEIAALKKQLEALGVAA